MFVIFTDDHSDSCRLWLLKIVLNTVQDRCKMDVWVGASITATPARLVVLRPVLNSSVKQRLGLERKATDGIFLTHAYLTHKWRPTCVHTGMYKHSHNNNKEACCVWAFICSFHVLYGESYTQTNIEINSHTHPCFPAAFFIITQ